MLSCAACHGRVACERHERIHVHCCRRRTCVHKCQPSLSESMDQDIHTPNPSLLGSSINNALQSKDASKYSDISLISSDEVIFPSIRTLLVISSPFFDKLLTSDFAEKYLENVPVSIHSTVLREVLEFIYSDDCSLIRNIRARKQLPVPCNSVLKLTELAHAADFLQMERLLAVCKKSVEVIVARFPHTSCVVLDALCHIGGEWSTSLHDTALASIATSPKRSLLRTYDSCTVQPGILHFSERSLEPTLKHVIKRNFNSQVGAQDIFQSLIIWTSRGATMRPSEVPMRDFNYDIFVDMTKTGCTEERMVPATRFAAYFNLCQFHPHFLSDIVETSGLCPISTIKDAYKEQLFLLKHLEIDWEKGPEQSSDSPS